MRHFRLVTNQQLDIYIDITTMLIDVNDTLLFAASFAHLSDLPRKVMVGPNRMWKKNRE